MSALPLMVPKNKIKKSMLAKYSCPPWSLPWSISNLKMSPLVVAIIYILFEKKTFGRGRNTVKVCVNRDTIQ